MKFVVVAILIAAIFSGCSSWASGAQKKSAKHKSWEEVENASGSTPSAEYGDAQLIGTVSDKSLTEISGIAASQINAGVFWVHNDSGDKARIFAINAKGNLLATVNVVGAKNVDWEDIGIGPGKDGKAALYISDAGNNGGERDNLVIYRIPEPKIGAEKKLDSAVAEAFPFRYPDGNHDSEAIIVNPQNGQIYLVTKTMKSSCGVYRFPLPLRPSEKVTLEEVRGKQISKIQELRLVTGASVSPDGLRVVLRTYFSAFELQREKGKPFETIFDKAPTTISVPLMRQAEAITYTADSKALVTTTEKNPAPLFQIMRQ